MGVCGPGRNDGEMGRGCEGNGVVQRDFGRADTAYGYEAGECVRAVRYARERLGMVRGLVWRLSENTGDRSERPCEREVSDTSRRFVEGRLGRRAFVIPRWPFAINQIQRHGLSRRCADEVRDLSPLSCLGADFPQERKEGERTTPSAKRRHPSFWRNITASAFSRVRRRARA